MVYNKGSVLGNGVVDSDQPATGYNANKEQDESLQTPVSRNKSNDGSNSSHCAAETSTGRQDWMVKNEADNDKDSRYSDPFNNSRKREDTDYLSRVQSPQ
jgi:hypothetical protein